MENKTTQGTEKQIGFANDIIKRIESEAESFFKLITIETRAAKFAVTFDHIKTLKNEANAKFWIEEMSDFQISKHAGILLGKRVAVMNTFYASFKNA